MFVSKSGNTQFSSKPDALEGREEKLKQSLYFGTASNGQKLGEIKMELFDYKLPRGRKETPTPPDTKAQSRTACAMEPRPQIQYSVA